MKYSIGEVSQLLQVSRDMIRYYEMQGTIHAKRNEENGYRYYDEMDVFWLLEGMQHKSWGINIGEISAVRLNQYAEKTSESLDQIAQRLEEEIAWEKLLVNRLKELRDMIGYGYINIGNYQIKLIPAHYRIHLIDGIGDKYDRFDFPNEAGKELLSDRALPFTDSGFTIHDQKESWELLIEKKYADALNVAITDDFELINERLCLCTSADIGEVGSFDLQAVQELKEYAQKRSVHFLEAVPVRSLLTGRGMEDGTFHRVVELQLDIQF